MHVFIQDEQKILHFINFLVKFPVKLCSNFLAFIFSFVLLFAVIRSREVIEVNYKILFIFSFYCIKNKLRDFSNLLTISILTSVLLLADKNFHFLKLKPLHTRFTTCRVIDYLVTNQ
jgi:hypothetical protein